MRSMDVMSGCSSTRSPCMSATMKPAPHVKLHTEGEGGDVGKPDADSPLITALRSLALWPPTSQSGMPTRTLWLLCSHRRSYSCATALTRSQQARDERTRVNLLYGGETAVVESTQGKHNFFKHRAAYGSNLNGGGCRRAQVSQAQGRVGVVDVEADTCNETERGRAAAVCSRGWGGAAAALHQHSTNFYREGAEDVYVVGPFDSEHVAQLWQLALHAAHNT